MRRFVLLFVDLSLIAMATVAALVLRDNLVISAARLTETLPYLGATLAAATVILPSAGVNRTIWRFSSLGDYLQIVGASIAIVLCAIAIAFADHRLEGVARSLPILQGILMVIGLAGVRVAMRLRHNARATKSADILPHTENVATDETVLVMGLNSVAELFLQSVTEFAANQIKVAGLLGRTQRHTGRLVRQYKILGTTDQLEEVLRDLEVHGVFVDRIVVACAFETLSVGAQHNLLRIERSSNIRVDFFAQRIGLCEGQHRAARMQPPQDRVVGDEGVASISVNLMPGAARPYWRIKRALDVFGAICLLVLLAPVLGLVAAIVAIDIGLPTVFWQERPGLQGRPFKLFKFRTMAAAHDAYGYRIQDDERSSAVGRFLRRTRLDELPQLFNILVGHMSFVGPRPLLPVDQSREHNYRLLARPGLTGWAQVNGGRNLSAEDKSALDVWYIKNASLKLDLKVTWLTFATLIGGERPNGWAVDQARVELGIGKPVDAIGFRAQVAQSTRSVA